MKTPNKEFSSNKTKKPRDGGGGGWNDNDRYCKAGFDLYINFLSGFSMGMGVADIIVNSFEKRDKSDKKRNRRNTDRNPSDKF